MSIIFKLVGTNINQEYIIIEKFIGIINLEILNIILLKWELTIEEILQIKFIRKGSQITNDNCFEIGENEEYIFIYSKNDEVKLKLKYIFENYKNVNIITNENLKSINEETIILFRDNDFKNLLDIYKRRPELFQLLLQYTYSGNVTCNINKIDDYSSELKIINELNLNLSNDKILDKLIKYGGHLNLTLRSLLCEL
jgi:hypothetical protein